MAKLGTISRSDLQFQQNSAHGTCAIAEVFAALRASCQRLHTHRWGPRPSAFCLVRDPHSYRSVLFAGQPVSFFATCADLCCNCAIALAAGPRKGALFSIDITKKGTKTCLRKLGSSQQPPHSPLRVAWKPTFSAASLVPLLALPRPRFWAQTRLQPGLRAHPQACCVTTPVSAAPHAKTSAARIARPSSINRRRGSASAAVLRSKDPMYV